MSEIVEIDTMARAQAAPENPKQSSWASKILLCVITLAIFIEGGSRVVLSINRLRQRVTGFDDSSYRLQWIRLHRIHQEWTGQYAIYHPTRGWALKPDVKQLSVFHNKILNSNSKGLRAGTDYQYERDAGKQRIVVLGDSFTFGEEVSDDETYSHDLESSLPRTEVLNLGVQGYGNDQMLMYLKDEGVKYHPDVVLLGFAYLDIYRNIESFFAYAKPRFEIASDGLQLTNVPVPTPEQVLAEEAYRPKALDLMVILREKLRWSLGKNEAEAREVSSRLLDQIVATTRGIGATPVFVYLPVYEEIQPLPKSSYPLTASSPPVEDRETYLREFCQARGIPCLFLRSRFHEEVQKGANFNAAGHWNAKAHDVAAQEIKDFLLQKNLIQAESGLIGRHPSRVRTEVRHQASKNSHLVLAPFPSSSQIKEDRERSFATCLCRKLAERSQLTPRT